MRQVITGLFVFVCLVRPAQSRAIRKFFRYGHISHGLNNFNGELIANVSQSSNLFSGVGPLYEIGVVNREPGATNASEITPTTPLDSLVGSLDAQELQQSLGFPRGVGPFNIPLQDTGVLTVLSKNVNDRTKPNSFSSTKGNFRNLLAYLPFGASTSITLRDWNRPSALINSVCYRDGTSIVNIKLREGMPNALYTAWDVGVSDALKASEGLSVGPLGGVVNVIITDSGGNGSLRRKLNYCLFDKCPGSKRCTIYVSLLYHMDHQNYGASFALDAAGPAVGVVAANQIQFYINGQPLIPVQNPFYRFFRKVF